MKGREAGERFSLGSVFMKDLCLQSKSAEDI